MSGIPGPHPVSLDEAVKRIGEISTIRESAIRVMQVANDPDADAVDLAEAIGHDAALSARLIRTVNSAAYGLRRKVHTISGAVVRLGFKRVRNLALAAMVCDLFQTRHQIGPYDRQRLWPHLVGVGVGARVIATAIGYDEPEEAFLAGLLHDIGIILEDQYLHEGFERVMSCVRENETLTQTEADVFGFDHAQLGRRIAEGWKFPESVTDAIAYHHRPEAYVGDADAIVYAVAVANWICALHGPSALGSIKIVPPPPSILERLNLHPDEIAVIADDIHAELLPADLLLVV